MTTSEKLNYLFSKINWGASALDAEAIQIMNSIIRETQDLESAALVKQDNAAKKLKI